MLTQAPALALPTINQATLGWAISVAVALGPTVFNSFVWQRRLRQWWRYLALWRAKVFWVSVGGSLAAGAGVLLFVALLPAWERQWTDWYIAFATTPGGGDLPWIQAMQRQEATMVRLCAGALLLGGLALILAAQSRLGQRLALTPRGPDDWLVTAPEPNAAIAPPPPDPALVSAEPWLASAPGAADAVSRSGSGAAEFPARAPAVAPETASPPAQPPAPPDWTAPPPAPTTEPRLAALDLTTQPSWPQGEPTP